MTGIGGRSATGRKERGRRREWSRGRPELRLFSDGNWRLFGDDEERGGGGRDRENDDNCAFLD